MRKTLIAANWKMNMLRWEAEELTRSFLEHAPDAGVKTDVVIAPPYTVLDVVRGVLDGSQVELGAQNVFWEEKGAYTGEISPGMLKDAGCRWVIIGHSERRSVLGETDEMVKRKVSASLESGLQVILCVGESLEERERGKTIKTVTGQVEIALAEHKLEDQHHLVIAYEPVWAIGTGKNATPDEAEYVQGTIREITGNIFGDKAENIRIIYGGSVTGDNIKELLTEPNIDGALVGGASLKHDSLAKIVQIAGE
jgi:triosephosphate isomerase